MSVVTGFSYRHRIATHRFALFSWFKCYTNT